MSTNFPTSLDNSSTIPVESATTKLSVNHVVAHQNIQDAIEAIEAKLGIDGSAVTTSHDYKLSEITSTDKAVGKTATQTITNKTLGTGTKISLGSDATGDIYYNGGSGTLTRLPVSTNGFILKLAAGIPSWVAETVTNNASTTVAGIVEEATQAQVDAETGTGETGARLFINPTSISNFERKTISLTAVNDITIGQPVSIGYGQTDGGIKIDTSNYTTGTGATNTQSITVASNSNRGLVVFVSITGISANDTITGVTYAGVSMTQVTSVVTGGVNGFTQRAYAFYLNAPTTGANNLVISHSGSQDVIFHWYSIYNVSQSGQPEVNGTTASGTSSSITTTANGARVFGFSGNPSGNPGTPTGTATYGGVLNTNNHTSYNSAIVLPGSVSVTATTGVSGSFILMSVAPVTTVTQGIFPSFASTSTYSQYQTGYQAFVGFAAETISAGNTCKVYTNVATGLSGITIGAQYYVANTAGTISTSAGTNTRKVGIGLSTTSLLITNIW